MAYGFDAESEVFADFDGLSDADDFVIDHKVEVVVGVFREFDNAAGSEVEYIFERFSAVSEPDDNRYAYFQDGFDFGCHIELLSVCKGFDIKRKRRSCCASPVKVV